MAIATCSSALNDRALCTSIALARYDELTCVLPTLPATTFQCPADEDGKAKLALEIDQAMRERAPAGWKGDEIREKQVLNALYPIMARDRAATQGIFEIIKNQPGY
jgi:type I restriction enzyme, R subunit